MKVRKVFKYATGEAIPEGAKYLCTQVEKKEIKGKGVVFHANLLVWHYYEVTLAEEKADA